MQVGDDFVEREIWRGRVWAAWPLRLIHRDTGVVVYYFDPRCTFMGAQGWFHPRWSNEWGDFRGWQVNIEHPRIETPIGYATEIRSWGEEALARLVAGDVPCADFARTLQPDENWPVPQLPAEWWAIQDSNL